MASCKKAARRALLGLLGAALLLVRPAGEALPAAAEGRGGALIALTFDDGPRRATTGPLLDGLAARGARATFFLIGRQIPDNEDLVLRMGAEGHQVGLHTYDHVLLTGRTAEEIGAQLEPCRLLLSDLLGEGPFLLRPPYGLTDSALLAAAGCPLILWSVDPEDWRDRDAARTAAHILDQAGDGSIVLLHDIFPESVEAALQVVDALQARGCTFVTVGELFAARGVELEPGRTYRSACP